MLEPIAADVWGVPGEESFPGGVRLPTRMTVVRLPDGSVWLHSPVPLDEATAREIDAIGPVGHVVAPSLLHHLHAAAARRRWPGAKLYGAVGLAEKRPDLEIDQELGDQTAWGSVIATCRLRGAPRINEVVFFHHPSGTLLCTDLVFNLARPANLATRLVTTVWGTNGRLAASRLWGWVFVEDRAAMAASVRAALDWPIERVVPCHGDVVEREALPALIAATARLV
jgi:hypothetical protein